MNDFNTEKTVRILQQNRRSVLLKMILVVLFLIAIALGENYTLTFVQNTAGRITAMLLFWIIRLFFYLPLCIGIFRSIYLLSDKKSGFVLEFFSDLKSYFGVVLSGLFTSVAIIFQLMMLLLFYKMSVEIFGPKSWILPLFLTVGIAAVFCSVICIIYSVIVAFSKDTRSFLSAYISNFGRNGIVKAVGHLRPCVNRLVLLIFILPALYVLPFTFVRMSLREK